MIIQALCFVYFLKSKSDSVKATEKFLADVAPYGQVKCVRSDNGTEFTGHEFQTLLRGNRIRHETSAPYSPHQNGTAERGWRTLYEMSRCLLIESGLPDNLIIIIIIIHLICNALFIRGDLKVLHVKKLKNRVREAKHTENVLNKNNKARLKNHY